MTIFQPYKQIIAVILIAVYTFIATPVQIWHHHHHSKDLQVVNAKNTIVFKNTNSISETNCPICQHQYSIYNDDAIFISAFPVIEFLFEPESSTQQLSSFFVIAFSNKGPPLCC